MTLVTHVPTSNIFTKKTAILISKPLHNHVKKILWHNLASFCTSFSYSPLKRRKMKGKIVTQGGMGGPDIANLCRADRWPRQNQCMWRWQRGLDGNMKYLAAVNGGGCSRYHSLSSQDCLYWLHLHSLICALSLVRSGTGTQSVCVSNLAL